MAGYGSCFFAFCTLPQCIKVYKSKSTNDISWLFIFMSLGGNIFSGIYIFLNNLNNENWMWPQYFNYFIASICMISLLLMKRKYRKN